MNRSYTLLRANKQIGPLSFEELQSLSLQPNDLIWKEGNNRWMNVFELTGSTPVSNTTSTFTSRNEEVILTIKYQQSLEDLQRKYQQWKQEPKRSIYVPTAVITIATALVFMFITIV